MTALLSGDGKYRYMLSRGVDGVRPGPLSNVPLVWVMLNPSTADALADDPTIRRVIAFTRREGRRYLTVVNLFAYRATDPSRLGDLFDPVGSAPADCASLGRPDNDTEILSAFMEIGRGGFAIAAWGGAQALDRQTRVLRARRISRVLGHAAIAGITLKCFGKTAAGDPRHPLYLPGTTPLVEWT